MTTDEQLAEKAGIEGQRVETCQMFHEEPYDFAYCEAHDTTFALGDKCKFEGRVMWEVYAEEADDLRGRAVVAEMQRDEAIQWLSLYVDQEPCRFDHHGWCQNHGPHSELPPGFCHMVAVRSLVSSPEQPSGVNDGE